MPCLASVKITTLQILVICLYNCYNCAMILRFHAFLLYNNLKTLRKSYGARTYRGR